MCISAVSNFSENHFAYADISYIIWENDVIQGIYQLAMTKSGDIGRVWTSDIIDDHSFSLHLIDLSCGVMLATAQLRSPKISPKVVHDLVGNSVFKAHYIIQRPMRFCKPWVYKVVCT